MLENDIYWIWIQKALGFGSKKIKSIIEDFKTAKEFFDAGEKEWRFMGCFTPREINKLSTIKLSDCEEIIKKVESLGQKIITPEHKLYPEKLKSIYNPPCVLYYKGVFPCVDDSICISIVGTRNASLKGMNMAFDFAFNLAKFEAIIISGGAKGIDSAAHRGALKALGKTMCVLGCGLNYNYLKENEDMRNSIIKNGTLLSEFPPDTPAFPRNFPMRNRIISALSNGTLIVEAGPKSGSLITANLAMEQGRDVFAIPGDIESMNYVGANNLIKDGAIMVTCIDDIWREYINIDNLKSMVSKYKYVEKTNTEFLESENTENNNKIQQQPNKIGLPENISEISRKVYEILDLQPQHVDVISYKAKVSTKDTLRALTELELLGLISGCSGRRYKLN